MRVRENSYAAVNRDGRIEMPVLRIDPRYVWWFSPPEHRMPCVDDYEQAVFADLADYYDSLFRSPSRKQTTSRRRV
ncbi:hypothetical protein SAMN05421505_11832 [Sinosporangium album]|uniref:Uncharacterized protein n=1 Tax=Sinosporangium album TaxID=504805 RepID=A0A1G8DFC5_9ACTN|nr:hypothetical protein [Sinosporangium album]SDH56382.1 hypothetical protein SAMN05421505_11832 [Sinosporangium album]